MPVFGPQVSSTVKQIALTNRSQLSWERANRSATSGETLESAEATVAAAVSTFASPTQKPHFGSPILRVSSRSSNLSWAVPGEVGELSCCACAPRGTNTARTHSAIESDCKPITWRLRMRVMQPRFRHGKQRGRRRHHYGNQERIKR